MTLHPAMIVLQLPIESSSAALPSSGNSVQMGASQPMNWSLSQGEMDPEACADAKTGSYAQK